jgi:hypothetical protein
VLRLGGDDALIASPNHMAVIKIVLLTNYYKELSPRRPITTLPSNWSETVRPRQASSTRIRKGVYSFDSDRITSLGRKTKESA